MAFRKCVNRLFYRRQSCRVCNEVFKKTDLVMVTKCCKHVLHLDCLTKLTVGDGPSKEENRAYKVYREAYEAYAVYKKSNNTDVNLAEAEAYKVAKDAYVAFRAEVQKREAVKPKAKCPKCKAKLSVGFECRRTPDKFFHQKYVIIDSSTDN